MDTRPVVIFDGVCNFCNGVVNFIIKRDPDGRFAFAPMQSAVGQQLAKDYGLRLEDIDTFLLVKDRRCYEGTDAALEIVKDLTAAWPLFRVFIILPRPFRDWFYRLVARNRYSLFGKRDTCMVPSDDVRERFLQ